MKKLLTSLMFLFVFWHEAGATCLISACVVGANFTLSGLNCATYSEICYGDGTVGYISCDSCPSGYTMASEPGTPDTCNNSYNTCEQNTVICSAGSYGVTDCTLCPTPGTSVTGSQYVTSCYVPTTLSITDSTGTYNYTSSCYYSL